MTQRMSSQRLRPCLLDRLTDHDPDSQVETAHDQTVAAEELRDLVRRDLTWLFNTTRLSATMDLSAFPHTQRSILNFGLADLTGHMLSSIELEPLEAHVREVLSCYEPRLSPHTLNVTVNIGSNQFGAAALIIDIEAELFAEPLPLALHLRTEVDVETGRVTVDEVAADTDYGE